MGRTLRTNLAGYVYHVLNRSNGRATLFTKDGDYAAFERVLREAQERYPTRLLGYCVMPNHWHLVLWPKQDGELSQFLRWLTLTHTQRWHAHFHSAGTGHLYQGRFKSFPVQSDDHLLTVLRYVERNALRAGLVARAELWPWGSLWQRGLGDGTDKPCVQAGPVALPADWVEGVNAPQTEAELTAVRRSVVRGQPFGGERWVARTATALHLETTLRPQGRPKIAKNGS